jgi:hypothetical protein
MLTLIEGSARIIAEHERRVAEIDALRAKDGSNAQQVDRLIAQSAAVRDALEKLQQVYPSRWSRVTGSSRPKIRARPRKDARWHEDGGGPSSEIHFSIARSLALKI